jgi:hypothetical protein
LRCKRPFDTAFAMIFPSEVRRLTRAERVALLIAAALIALSAAARPLNPDEGQYVAATALMRSGLLYRDFAYLQTPLQPLLLAPLSMLPAGWLFVASRIVNALFGWASLILMASTLRRWVSSRTVVITVGTAVCCEPFLFGSSIARNDALPMLLITAALSILLPAVESDGAGLRRFFLAGLLFGLAASAKINFALPAAAAGASLLFTSKRQLWLTIASFVGGAMAGLLPTFVMALIAPRQFFFDVFTYSLAAPLQWWTAVGEGDRFLFATRVWALVRLSARGTILPALAMVIVDRKRRSACVLLDLMIVAGLVASYLPEPAFQQYLLPLLPPLFFRLAFALETAAPRWRYIAPVLLVVGATSGARRTVQYVAKSASRGLPLAQAVRQGRAATRIAHGASIATLSPAIVAGSDVALEPGFVTGPFLFRTHGSLATQAYALGGSLNWQRLGYLDRHAPGAILVGGEQKPYPPLHPQGLDHHLVRWAQMHGYRPVPLPGGLSLYMRDWSSAPARQSPPR